MRIRTALLTSLLLVGGCSLLRPSSTPPPPNIVTVSSAETEARNAAIQDALRAARAALEQDRPQAALAHLKKARTLDDNSESTTALLLRAELNLLVGEPDEALTIAEEILETHPDHLAGNEIAGKALLQLGLFEDAEDHFATALSSSAATGPQRRQAEDLLRLAQGFAAYAASDPDEAVAIWRGIEDPRIRSTLEQTMPGQIKTIVADLPQPTVSETRP